MSERSLAASRRKLSIVMVALVVMASSLLSLNLFRPQAAQAYTPVSGQNYKICDLTSQYLTSPWTYSGLASGSQQYTVSEYQALPGYGTTLPPLPSYISNQGPSAPAAVIFAPGSDTSQPPYAYPATPLLYFFEGGAYGIISFQSVSGSLYIGGSAPGYPLPTFDNGGVAAGIASENDSYSFSGGSSTLASGISSGATNITTTTAIPGFINRFTFADGSTYDITSTSGTSITLSNPVSSGHSAGSQVWGSRASPIADVASPASQGATSFTLTSSTMPLVKYGQIRVGDHAYQIDSVSGNQSGYTVSVAAGGLDMAIAASTPVYYDNYAGGVTVQYLDIAHDEHVTTGTIHTGSGWTVSHNRIHDGYSTPGTGVAIYGGDQSVIEYNCFSRMGTYAANIFGTNNKFRYNEVFETNYLPDPGCGCSGGGKWWGTLNADIVDNAFVRVAPGNGAPIWLDNGNSGTLISGNYFDSSIGSAIHSETGYNLNVNNNLFVNGGWGDGTGGCDINCNGAINLNHTGGWNVPDSRYQNQVLVTNNQFINNWSNVSIWQAGARSCENSGQGWPYDASYCSGGYPYTTTATAGGQFYFSHTGDSNYGDTTALVSAATAGSSTILVERALAINDQIGFGSDPATTTTSSTTNVSSLSSSTITVTSTASFPSSGQLRVGTSAAWSGGEGSYTGAILSYTGKTATTFTGVSLVRGSGTLTGPVRQVDPYKVVSQTCYANNCAVTITPALASNVASGSAITNAGTCQLFAVPGSLPSGPLAPSGESYWEGCQWGTRNISIANNTFLTQPSQISAGTALNGQSVSCTPANNCGNNFMAFQVAGEPPFSTNIGANAMMSNSALTGCPTWDPGCSSNPLSNLNALANPPGAPAGNGAAPGNITWANNTYKGPIDWSNTYLFGTCFPLPTDSSTGNSMPASGACDANFAEWRSNWGQDSGSTYNPINVTLSGLADGQKIHGPSQGVSAYADSGTAGAINTQLKLNTDTISSLSAAPYNFNLNTLNHPNGQYTLSVTGTDTGSNTHSDSMSIYINNGDLNDDDVVNLSDLAIMANHWQQTDSNYGHGNITGNSTIGLPDLAILAANWGWSKQ